MKSWFRVGHPGSLPTKWTYYTPSYWQAQTINYQTRYTFLEFCCCGSTFSSASWAACCHTYPSPFIVLFGLGNFRAWNRRYSYVKRLFVFKGERPNNSMYTHKIGTYTCTEPAFQFISTHQRRCLVGASRTSNDYTVPEMKKKNLLMFCNMEMVARGVRITIPSTILSLYVT